MPSETTTSPGVEARGPARRPCCRRCRRRPPARMPCARPPRPAPRRGAPRGRCRSRAGAGRGGTRGCRPTSSRCRTRRRRRWSTRRGRWRRRRGSGRSASRGGARRCGRGPGVSGSWAATQRSLLTVVAATGTRPVASAQACAPSSATSSSAACADRVSFHSKRVSHDLAVLVEQHHAVLLPADRDGGDAVEDAVPTRLLPGRPPVAGVDLGAVGVGGATGADHLPGLGVADDDLARLGRRVDPGDERAVRHGVTLSAVLGPEGWSGAQRWAHSALGASRRPGPAGKDGRGTGMRSAHAAASGQCCSARLHIVHSSVRIRRGWDRV